MSVCDHARRHGVDPDPLPTSVASPSVKLSTAPWSRPPKYISIFRFDMGRPSRLQPPSGAEYQDQCGEARGDEQRREPEAGGDADVAFAVEAPAEAADEIDHRIEQADGPPERRQ